MVDNTVQTIVNSHNDWDPLEEVIVGNLVGWLTPPLEMCYLSVMHKELLLHEPEIYFRRSLELAGKPSRLQPGLSEAQRCLDEFIHILQSEGIVIRRPDSTTGPFHYSTPDWPSIRGFGQATPRDVMVVIGDRILESTMSFRSRYWEINSYRSLIKEYFKTGAKWIPPPKPQLNNALYNFEYERGKEFVLTEFEPVFEAADLLRLGKDILVQRSNVTNEFGIEWIRRILEPTYRVHTVEFRDYRAHHIDATFVPLAEGKILVSPDRPMKSTLSIFTDAKWEFLACPETTMTHPCWSAAGKPKPESGIWIHMNVLSLDDRRVIVEANEEPLIKALIDWGFLPIPCNFRAFYPFGGGFHCATCDIRRRGTLKSYF